jgi:hypothetical protein
VQHVWPDVVARSIDISVWLKAKQQKLSSCQTRVLSTNELRRRVPMDCMLRRIFREESRQIALAICSDSFPEKPATG